MVNTQKHRYPEGICVMEDANVWGWLALLGIVTVVLWMLVRAIMPSRATRSTYDPPRWKAPAWTVIVVGILVAVLLARSDK